ncbi:variant surface glycoprotein [Legionella jordanis]|nr:hypothetical protein [Legionella jordanis]
MATIKRKLKRTWHELTAKGPKPPELTKQIIEQAEDVSDQRINQFKKAKSQNVKQREQEHLQKDSDEKYKKWQEKLEELKRGGAEAYVEWQTGMARIMGSLQAFVEYMSTLWPWQTALHVPSPSWDKADSDKLEVTPNVSYKVGLDNNGFLQTQLNIKHKQADGTVQDVQTTPQQAALFDEMFERWLEENDHSIVVDAQGRKTIKNDSTGATLDAQALKDLKTDPGNGFQSWLSNLMAMSVDEDLAPPSPGLQP